jgi:hypothetical protein
MRQGLKSTKAILLALILSVSTFITAFTPITSYAADKSVSSQMTVTETVYLPVWFYEGSTYPRMEASLASNVAIVSVEFIVEDTDKNTIDYSKKVTGSSNTWELGNLQPDWSTIPAGGKIIIVKAREVGMSSDVIVFQRHLGVIKR